MLIVRFLQATCRLLFVGFLLSTAWAEDSVVPPTGDSVVTPADDSATVPPPVSYPRIKMGGQVQMQIDEGSIGSNRSQSGNPVRNGIGRFPVDNALYVRRLRLLPTIEFSDRLRLFNETDIDNNDFEDNGPKLTMLDLYFRYDINENHHLRAGQFKLPFGQEFWGSSREVTTVERSDVSRQLFQRDIGIGLFGEEGRFEYGVGLFQGQGENTAERNGALDVSARLVYRLSPGLRIGASGQLGSYRPTRHDDDIRVRRGGLEIEYHDGPWSLEGEYLFSDGFNLFSESATTSRGYYLYSTLKVQEPIDIVLGYDRFDPDTGSVGGISDANRMNDRDRFTIGLNYYLSRKPVHRFMLNYEFRNELEGPSASTQGFRLRYQYSW